MWLDREWLRIGSVEMIWVDLSTGNVFLIRASGLKLDSVFYFVLCVLGEG